MKNLIFLSVSVFFSVLVVKAQNVGIGEPNPNSKLEVKGDGTTNATSSLNATDNNGSSVLYVSDAHQVGVNTATPDASAALDITSTSAGVLIPRLTDAQMNGVNAPATGLLVFNSTQNNFYYFDGAAWVALINTNNQQQGGGGAGDPTLVYTTDGF